MSVDPPAPMPPAPMRAVYDTITVTELEAMAANTYGDLVKAVVDLASEIMVIGGELHADEEAYLLESGFSQQNLWGINLYPDQFGTDGFIGFDSMINLRPSQHNRSRSVEDPAARAAIVNIVGRPVRAENV